MSDRNEGDYNLVMPFVVVQSKGGPYDDGAYVAGCELGDLMARMRLAKELNYDFPDQVVHRENVPQVDLAAMHYGLVMTEVPWADDLEEHVASEWARLSFQWADLAEIEADE